MSQLDQFLSWLSIVLLAVLCVLIYRRGVHRRLPFFAAHGMLMLVGALGVQTVYHFSGFYSTASYEVGWIVVGAIAFSRGLAIAELCRYELRDYRGIWALTWRVLAVLAVFSLGHALIDAWGQPSRVAIYGLTTERDVGIASVVILLAMLVIRNYYGLILEPLQKWIVFGMFFVCLVDFINNSTARYEFTQYLSFWFFTKYAVLWPGIGSQIEQVNAWWNAIRGFGFVISIGTWCYALLMFAPAPARVPTLLPEEVYAKFSPALNLRLRRFNDRLLELRKP